TPHAYSRDRITDTQLRLRSSAFGLLLLTGCSRETATTTPIRLVDLYRPEFVENRVTPTAAPPRLEWRFDGPAGTAGWSAGIGVSNLTVRNGRLTGRASMPMPILAVEVPELP